MSSALLSDLNNVLGLLQRLFVPFLKKKKNVLGLQKESNSKKQKYGILPLGPAETTYGLHPYDNIEGQSYPLMCVVEGILKVFH